MSKISNRIKPIRNRGKLEKKEDNFNLFKNIYCDENVTIHSGRMSLTRPSSASQTRYTVLGQ